jgi:hypothetical protein
VKMRGMRGSFSTYDWEHPSLGYAGSNLSTQKNGNLRLMYCSVLRRCEDLAKLHSRVETLYTFGSSIQYLLHVICFAALTKLHGIPCCTVCFDYNGP